MEGTPKDVPVTGGLEQAGTAPKRHLDEAGLADFSEAPALKRKKTVTWADGKRVPGTSSGTSSGDVESGSGEAEEGEEESVSRQSSLESHDTRGPSTVAQQGPAQRGSPPSSPAGALTLKQLLERRLEAVEDLAAIYTEQLWDTLDELGHAAAGLGGRGGDASAAPGSGDVALPGAGHAGVADQAPAAAPVAPQPGPPGDDALHPSVREWLRRRALGADGAQLAACPPPPLFEVAEEALLTGVVPSRAPAFTGAEARAGPRRAFHDQLAHVSALERLAAASLSRWLDGGADGALAVLVGRRGRWALTRGAAVLGRGGGAGAAGPGTQADAAGPKETASPTLPLDVDLSLEAGPTAANRVSRRQALLWVPTETEGAGGARTKGPAALALRCIGRRPMRVNGGAVPPGTSVLVPHASLVQVGGVSLLVLLNHAALARYAGRAAAASA
ncbi:hypothetical protein ACKKBG_A38340 [Auxenochlorella protothecoides x Auxenochlorella symbiontica]